MTSKMKNKTVILILSVLAVAIYTTAATNFCTGNVLGGIGDVLMASFGSLAFGALMAYTHYRVGLLGRMSDRTRKDGDQSDGETSDTAAEEETEQK